MVSCLLTTNLIGISPKDAEFISKYFPIALAISIILFIIFFYFHEKEYD